MVAGSCRLVVGVIVAVACAAGVGAWLVARDFPEDGADG